jgi:hypothetical protein
MVLKDVLSCVTGVSGARRRIVVLSRRRCEAIRRLPQQSRLKLAQFKGGIE